MALPNNSEIDKLDDVETEWKTVDFVTLVDCLLHRADRYTFGRKTYNKTIVYNIIHFVPNDELRCPDPD